MESLKNSDDASTFRTRLEDCISGEEDGKEQEIIIELGAMPDIFPEPEEEASINDEIEDEFQDPI